MEGDRDMEIGIVSYEHPESECMKQFRDRLQMIDVGMDYIGVHGKAYGYEIYFDDPATFHTHKKIGAPQKTLITENGENVTCGMVYSMKQKGFSDASIAETLNSSESTITRRRKKHISDGSFFEGSLTIF